MTFLRHRQDGHQRGRELGVLQILLCQGVTLGGIFEKQQIYPSGATVAVLASTASWKVIYKVLRNMIIRTN